MIVGIVAFAAVLVRYGQDALETEVVPIALAIGSGLMVLVGWNLLRGESSKDS
jgi:hypothetical protein